MRWFRHLIYGYIAIEYLATFVGFLWDDWRLTKFDTAFACFIVVLWAVREIVSRELQFLEGE